MRNFLERQSLDDILAELAAKDGFSVNGMKNLSALKAYLRTKGFEMPKSANSIWERIISFHELKYEEMKLDIDTKIKNDVRFRITLDEWTDLNG